MKVFYNLTYINIGFPTKIMYSFYDNRFRLSNLTMWSDNNKNKDQEYSKVRKSIFVRIVETSN